MDGAQLPIWGYNWLKPALFLHVKLLNRILVRSLLEQDWATALRILSMFHSVLLARSQPIYPWEPSIDVLRRLGQTDLVTKYLLALSVKAIQHKEKAFMELILHSLRENNVTNAYDQLISRIHLNPYRDNPFFHFYAGMMQLSMWDIKRRNNEKHGARMSCLAALRYFTKASEMNQEASICCLPYVLELLLHNGMLVRAERLLYKLCRQYPDRPELQQLRVEFYFSKQVLDYSEQLKQHDLRTNIEHAKLDDETDDNDDDDQKLHDIPSSLVDTGSNDGDTNYDSVADSIIRLQDAMTLSKMANDYFTLDPMASLALFQRWTEKQWQLLDVLDANSDQLTILLERLFDRVEYGDWSSWTCHQLIKTGIYAKESEHSALWHHAWQYRKSWWPRYLLNAIRESANCVHHQMSKHTTTDNTYHHLEKQKVLLICQVALGHLCLTADTKLPELVLQTFSQVHLELQDTVTILSSNAKRKRKESIESIESTESISGSEWEEEVAWNSDNDSGKSTIDDGQQADSRTNHVNHTLSSISSQTDIDIVQDIMEMLECRTLQELLIGIGTGYTHDREAETIDHPRQSPLASAVSTPIKKNNLGVNSTPQKLKYVQIDSDSDSEELALLSQAWNSMSISSNSYKNTNRMNDM